MRCRLLQVHDNKAADGSAPAPNPLVGEHLVRLEGMGFAGRMIAAGGLSAALPRADGGQELGAGLPTAVSRPVD